MKNYWPLGIFLLAMVVVGLIILTIKVAITNPVELQSLCQRNSQDIDANINEITQKNEMFLKKYNVSFEGALEQEIQSFRQVFVRLSNKANNKIETNAKVSFFITRPHTTKEDQILGEGELVDGLWQSKTFEVQNLGRYQSEALVEVGEDSICISQEYFIQK
ncbi:hypothetical protein [Helicobacter sp. MIT 05-5294]|uniref:hypothetical protein n=1 Tax=Helicobacter sp. MIT 05-5294 TaxID=1548150 RepID=UPI0010FCFDE6|nr:hypothetical protein [Helicobacter sp. MIT 05-5294]TLD88168.1 hypothetical protein LS69_002615 [Helicobacter sp. MIT 05-5294]